MNAEHWTDRLSEYLDGELAPAERAACEAHLATCASCQRVLAGLASVVRAAASLPPEDKLRDLWPGIRAAIEPGTPVLSLRPARPWLSTLPRLAAAAALIATLSGGSVWLAMRHGPSPAGPSMSVNGATPPATVRTAASRAEQTYDAAVSDLRKVLDAGRGHLDTATVRVLERNLATVDSAVADAQRAVASDPNNAYLNAYLARTMRRKVDLLRQAATLARAET